MKENYKLKVGESEIHLESQTPLIYRKIIAVLAFPMRCDLCGAADALYGKAELP